MTARQVGEQMIIGSIVILVVFLLLGCSPMVSQGMKADTMRAAIDECREQNLLVLLYQRPDSSVFAIHCIPKPEEIEQTVKVRPKMPVNLMRPFLQKQTMVIDE